MATRVDFWFDPLCPFAWATSRWISEVAKVREIDVVWNVMSLGVLNEGEGPGPDDDAEVQAAWLPSRAATAVVEKYGQDMVGKFYTALGSEIHYRDNTDYVDATAKALQELNLDEAILQHAKTDTHDEAMRASHHRGIEKVGQDVGTPILALGGTAFFGPVITRIPRGEEAGALFDAAVTLADYPYFFELKRSRSELPQFD